MNESYEQERQRILAEMEARARATDQPMNLKEWLRAIEESGVESSPLKSTSSSASTARATRRARRRARRAEKASAVASPLNDALKDDVLKLSGAQTTSSVSDPVSRNSAARSSHKEEPAMVMPSDGVAASQGNNRGLIIFSSVIGLTLMMALGGIGFLGYQKISEQLTVLQENDRKTSQRIDRLQTKLEQLEEKQNGHAPIVVQTQKTGEKGADEGTTRLATVHLDVLTEQLRQQLQEAGVITEMMLNTQLKQLQQEITQTVDKRFAALMAQLKALKRPHSASQAAASPDDTDSRNVSVTALPEDALIPTPARPAAPTVPTVRVIPSPAASEHEKEARKTPVAAASEKTAASSSRSTSAQTVLTADERWLVQQPGSYFTLQLASGRNRKSLLDMKALYGLQQARIVRHVKNGRTYYLLLTGLYKNKEAAFQAAEAMKARTGSMPWIRRLRALQPRLPH